VGVNKNDFAIRPKCHVTEGSQLKGVKPKMRERKLKSGVNWQEALRQKGIKQTGVKKRGG
jgi:hypothetical protein